MGDALSRPYYYSTVMLKRIRCSELGLVLEIEELPTLSEASVAVVLKGVLLQV